MVRLTAEVLLQADNYLNAYMAREINLRGLKVPTIENLSILQDQYDVIDLTDNDIKKLDNFPTMRRLNVLLVSNNSISRISTSVGEHLPRLQSLILSNNRISHLFEIDHISQIQSLEVLSLLENPVVLRPNYRLYTIFRMPSLKCLDFNKVTRQEREGATKLFKSSAGRAFLSVIEQEKQASTSVNGSTTAAAVAAAAAAPKKTIAELTDQQKAQVKRAIENATTKEQIDTIEYQLQTGTFPFVDEFVPLPEPEPSPALVEVSAESAATIPPPLVPADAGAAAPAENVNRGGNRKATAAAVADDMDID